MKKLINALILAIFISGCGGDSAVDSKPTVPPAVVEDNGDDVNSSPIDSEAEEEEDANESTSEYVPPERIDISGTWDYESVHVNGPCSGMSFVGKLHLPIDAEGNITQPSAVGSMRGTDSEGNCVVMDNAEYTYEEFEGYSKEYSEQEFEFANKIAISSTETLEAELLIYTYDQIRVVYHGGSDETEWSVTINLDRSS